MTRYIKNVELPAKNETVKTTWKIFKYGDPKVKLSLLPEYNLIMTYSKIGRKRKSLEHIFFTIRYEYFSGQKNDGFFNFFDQIKVSREPL